MLSTKSLDTSINSCISSSVFGLSDNPVVLFTETTCSILNKVLDSPSAKIFIDPTLPKLSFAKLTSEVPSGLIFTLNLVPFISRDIVGSSIIIDPLSSFAIIPDSIMTDPKSTLPK